MGGAGSLDLIGGHVAIDFVNTLAATVSEPLETLHTYADLIDWADHAGILAPAGADRLRANCLAHPARSSAVLARALSLRASLDDVFRAYLARGDPPSESLTEIGDAYAEAVRHGHLGLSAGTYGWAWPDHEDLASPLWPLAQQAVDLLRSDRLGRLSRCSDCRWLYLDHSRNRSRRWCRMKGCGSRAKMRRYRARSSGAVAGTGNGGS
ncbi:CGNR zinc finger domain-containing protein [Phytoactinopolyspora endophytica]|uniref:CGNR zinc finger domain-containing protein n=1 Tax=Phytoactinopolyspora endophytica TaxID=1642495 RepID=UPI00101CD81F|nr:ABATE domain-containing protein [Phytoactinopolyspora endophytica]